MRCERIQELILTDYMDKELDERAVREIDGHILSCAACREFKRVAESKTTQPFRSAQRVEAPSYIWERVKQEIFAEPERRSVIHFRPAVAFATAAVLIIAILVARPIVQTRAANEYMAEQIDFMMQLDIADTNGNGELFNNTDV